MNEKGILTMGHKDIKRLHVIQKVIENNLSQVQAGQMLGLSDRQVRRMVRRVEAHGAAGIKHASCGQRSRNAINERQKEKILRIYHGKYPGFGPTLAREKLLELDKIRISRETLRKWLIGKGSWQAKVKKRAHRQWRERKSHCGQMVQMDGSHHDWLEGRGPKLVLMGYIDDATNRIYARFYPYEGTIPAMDSFKRYVRRYGVPISVYLDRHTTYKNSGQPTLEDQLAGQERLSEFERVLQELGVEVIHANTPQAKGRIERLFKTLQDRLVKELRLSRAQNMEEANACLDQYLPQFNKRFSMTAIGQGDLHRPLTKGMRLEKIFCFKRQHRLRNDFTIVHQRQLYQILERTGATAVEVRENLDGAIRMVFNGRDLRYKKIDQKPEVAKPKPGSKRRIPAQRHPWRRYKQETGHFNFAEKRTF